MKKKNLVMIYLLFLKTYEFLNACGDSVRTVKKLNKREICQFLLVISRVRSYN